MTVWSGIQKKNITIGRTNTFNRLRNKFSFKDRQPKHLKCGVIYRIVCKCGHSYIGETGRNVLTRFREHMKTSGSGLTEVGKHLAASPGCSITFDDCNILGYSDIWFTRRIIESLYIQQYDDGKLLNEQKFSRPLYLFNLPAVRTQR